jgi:uncharacterized protein YjbI with pentapeptide repeats
MRVIKPLRLGLLHRAYPIDGSRNQLAIAILAMVPMRGARELVTEQAMWTFLPERLAPSGILDEGYAKARGEVIVRGGCYAHGADAVTESHVRVKVDDVIDATVRVTGDRVWLGDEPSKPQPFRVMPVDDAHALGGEDDLENPFGKGLVPVETEHGELHPLPNVEDPTRPMKTPKDRPLPAGLGPVFLGSPSRRDQAGTYDEEWVEKQFPAIAKDASPDIFQMARGGQRLAAGYFRGGERVTVWNMHPEHAVLEGTVPDLVARAFVRRRGVAEIEPVKMHLETLHLFPDAAAMVVLFRGVVAVEEPDASDLELVAIAAEALDAPRSLDHYERVVASRAGADRDALAFLRDDELLPPVEAWGATAMPKDELTKALELEGALGKRMKDARDRRVIEQREGLRAAGHDPDAYLPLPPPDPEVPTMDDPVALAEQVARLRRESEEKQKELEAKKIELEAEAKRSFAAAGMDWDAEKAKAERAAAGPPKPVADEHMKLVRDAIARAHELGGNLGELEAMASDPKWEPGLRERDAQRLAMYRQTAHLMPAARPLEGDDATLGKTRVGIALEAGEALRDMDLTGADLRELDLRGRDLRGALLEAARLDGAILDEADLTGAVLCRASLVGTSLRGAKLDDANLGDTTLRGGVFDGASMKKCVLMRARLDGASFRDADLSGTMLLEAVFGDVDLSGARMEKVALLKVDLRGVKLDGASLGQAQIVECDVSGVSFEGADLRSTAWVDTKAIGARFVDANMTQAAMSKGIDVTDASFAGATLDRASLRGATMPNASFVGARLRYADISEAKAAGARFDHADARGVLAIRTDLRGGSLRRASFLDALLTGADLRGVDATEAVLFQSDLALIVTDDHTKWDGAVRTRSNTRPRREVGAVPGASR